MNETTHENVQTRESVESPYLTRKELARKLKKSLRTIDAWVILGILPVIKVGRSVLFVWTDVQKALGKYRQGSRY